MKWIVFILGSLFAFNAAMAQTGSNNTNSTQQGQVFYQKVRGRVVDAESKQPLGGVMIVPVGDEQNGTVTDSNGYFSIEKVAVGRHSFRFSYMGFETYTVPEAMVITGKELELNVSLNESLNQLNEVTISANKDRSKPMNEFATISARSFSVEETRRYAASFSDPARMVMNFPGVSNAGDGDNSIVVRGNSPKGVLWRLEGIEIPNPNHFSSLGSSGGAISMLNANVLGTSDFYTGAFAPEYGNALSGVFDLNFRNGNTERYEHTVQLGTLGMEVGTEGPFKKGKRASYLFNYRYSTLALLKDFIGVGSVPAYQDASFKLNFPTEKAGTFSVFGLGGVNKAIRTVEPDSNKWDDDNPNIGYNNKSRMGVAGITHQIFTSHDAYIRTVISASYDKEIQTADTLTPADGYVSIPIENRDLSNTAYRMSVLYNRKLNARNTFRTGVIAQQLAYNFDYNYYDDNDKEWKNILNGSGSTQFYQAYFQWRARLTQKLTMVAGLHSSYLALNSKYSIEPRAAFTYQLNTANKFSLAAGLHSKPEHLSTYLFQDQTQGQVSTYPNKDLDLQRAFHLVAGYETMLPWKLRLKVEAYYQHLYSIPVESDSNTGFSIINAEDIYSLIGTKPLVSKGTGDNIGLDLSFERPFSEGFYILATGSIFTSTYTDYAGGDYNTRFNRGHQVNLIGGKEFKLGQSSRKVLGLNGKLLYSGGMRESVIDLDKSIASGQTELVPGQYYTRQGPYYMRADASIYYRVNNKRATHTLQLEVQNLTNRQNYYSSYFDRSDGSIKRVNQLGILPNLSYRIDFHW